MAILDRGGLLPKEMCLLAEMKDGNLRIWLHYGRATTEESWAIPDRMIIFRGAVVGERLRDFLPLHVTGDDDSGRPNLEDLQAWFADEPYLEWCVLELLEQMYAANIEKLLLADT